MGASKKQWEDEQASYEDSRRPKQRPFYAAQARHWQAEAEHYAATGDAGKEVAALAWVAFYSTVPHRLSGRQERTALLEQFRQFGEVKREPVTVEKQ